ncbi:acyltransferase family protein [Glaciimonas soli]|uniref:Acyltransferase family protein n=1 Tax=Glaciimonas soli TaxID=2590999 RepID=A0A843YRL4_9BURK|nr:acyltransferase [Glaciimonas soli]MQR00637.1 acyltransferase family protein [Glaciimonas soli]
MTEYKTAARLNGLDTLRAAAIVLVMAYHYMVVVSGKNTFGFMTEIGWAGVDLFFVLSGYLIGNQILSPIAQGRDFSLKTFYIKRLLRTLPNYYFILAMYFIFPLALGEKGAAPTWQFLTFTQNFGLRPGQTFTHSWSLCIEEQFYLILPAIALLIASFKGSRQLAWIAIGLAVVAGMIARSTAWLEHGRNAINAYDYYEHIYYSSFARFDELLPGVAIAMLKNFHVATYSKIMRKGNLLFVAGLTAVGTMFYLFSHFLVIPGYGFGFLMTTFGYPVLATSFAILTLSALSTNSILHRIRVPGATSIALWSYAIYLAHKPIFKLAISPLTKMGIDTNSILGIGIIITVSIFGGWLLFRLVETPFMELRARMYSVDGANGRATSNPAEALPKQSEAA